MDDGSDSLAARDVDSAVDVEKGSVVLATEPFTIEFGAGECIETGEHATGIRYEIEFVADEERGGHGGDTLGVAPRDLGLFEGCGRESNGEQFWAHEAGAEKDHTMTDDGACGEGEAGIAVFELPQLAPGGGVVGVEPVGSLGDQLIFAIDRNYERSGVGFFELGMTIHDPRAIGFPGELSGVFVEGHDELVIAAVHVNDEAIAPEHGRAAGAVFVLNFEILIFPEQEAGGGIETDRA